MLIKKSMLSTINKRPMPISTISLTLLSGGSANSINHSNTVLLASTCKIMELASIHAVLHRLKIALGYNDPNTDGAVIVQREVGDNLIILTIFAMQIWWIVKEYFITKSSLYYIEVTRLSSYLSVSNLTLIVSIFSYYQFFHIVSFIVDTYQQLPKWFFTFNIITLLHIKSRITL